ncbi:SDR family oxidoreductase [Lipingzhangella sp. LS1_29]|uniref:SDR family oxidoreductase n=1 Tax=Lipingzhangella rawalii TaxID=2055835 RepID=A0ABU2H896_9ACTN|nr:SDR family oxidoreductase [Lipingzhangella rawalii]MDS1271526.1 SDR family oxidoreductase [Lipingzhangella rawalii]
MRRVVVTGGGTGIGRAIAERFAGQGDEVFVVGRRKDRLEQVSATTPEGAIRPLVADLSNEEAVLRAAEELSDKPLDVLVNNAGGLVAREKDGLAGTFDVHRRVIERNLLTAMTFTEALWEHLTRPGGRVVNIGSIAGQRGGGGGYAAAKAGLSVWGFDLAAKGGPDGITVNTVSPGYVQDTEFFGENGRSARHDGLVAQTLLGRAGTPADVAATVAFLASDDAAWITGQVIGVNGGALLGR